MSDQSSPPTKPKPGSLRDRIAAFENKGAATPPGPASGAPVPRPKPGNLQWKPRPPSPPTSPDQSKIVGASGGGSGGGGGGMSAFDAKDSISRGGTLKERMAALQGKGAFGSSSPAPPVPIASEKPKWKPPPRAASPSTIDDGVAGRAASRSPPPRRTTSPSSDAISKVNEGEADAAATAGDCSTPDPEEERQRRAAIAARMARLGGTRIGMAPPIIAPKPTMRRPSVPVPASSPPPAPETVQAEIKTEEPEALQPSQGMYILDF